MLLGDQWTSEESDSEELVDTEEEIFDEDFAVCQNDKHEEMMFRFDETGAITEISWNWNLEDYHI